MQLRQLGFTIAVGVIAFAACTRVEEAGPLPPVPLASAGYAGEAMGPGSMAGAAGDAMTGQPLGPGGAPGTIALGLWPTFATDPARPGDTQAVQAAVSALSVGSMTLPLYRRWDDLSGSTGSPRAVTWTELDDLSKPYRDRNGNLALCIGVVDRADAAWPFEGELDSDQALLALQRTVDEVFARYAGQLTHLCFGYELDRYLAKASRRSQQRLLTFLSQAVTYASQHPMRGSKTAIGTALTLDALSRVTSTEGLLDDLLIGDEVVAVYDPLDQQGELKAPGSVSDELGAAIEALDARPGAALPLTLFEIGYPTSQDAGASESAQSKFYDALFGAVSSSRDALGFLGVFGLGDRAAADCAAEAAHFGDSAETEARRARVRCSMGLRAETDKPAWESVLAAFSRYR
ncbi:MAG TPA: hypothetical protein VEQ58_00325 [Polyangiaceae bacterium]|nr:hypothetical protein [Polyangiaceae bacterium]